MRLGTKISIKLRLMLPKFYFREQASEFFLDHIKPHIYFDRWSIQPFNGQARRFTTIAAIARSFKPTIGIETGTFLGSSTPYLASLISGEMFTIEIEPKSAKLARERFVKNHPKSKITLREGDSVLEMKNILKGINPQSERIVAYLDAHWYDAIPTTSEINALIDWGGPWIAIIDDFKVPSDENYKYDVYGDVEISQSILPNVQNLCLYVPSTPAYLETGRRKGTGYVCKTSEEEFLSDLPELTKLTLLK
jgi:hypothetical protein